MEKTFQEKLETVYGGCISFAQAATVLNVSERVLLQKMVAGEVIAVDCGGRYQFPKFQFKGGALLPGLSVVLEAAIKDDPEWLLDFLFEPISGDLSPAGLLLAGVTEIELYAIIAKAEELFGL